MEKKIETIVADTILQEPIMVKIGDREYKAAPACTATLIRVSEIVASKMPTVSFDKIHEISWTLLYAKDCKAVGDIVAVMILGVDGLTGIRTVKTIKKRFFGLIKNEVETEVFVDYQAELADLLLRKITPKELAALAKVLFNTMEVSSFFGLTTSLIEINLLRRTREVVTTASGR